MSSYSGVDNNLIKTIKGQDGLFYTYYENWCKPEDYFFKEVAGVGKTKELSQKQFKRQLDEREVLIGTLKKRFASSNS